MGVGQVTEKRHVAFWWKYGDGTVGVGIRDMSAEKYENLLFTATFNSREELDTTLSDQQCSCEEGGLQLEKIKLKLHSGIKYFVRHDAPKRNKGRGAFGWQELKKFLQACGTDTENRREVLRLFSGILSGYCARFTNTFIGKKSQVLLQDRAPVLLIRDANSIFDFLTQTMCALAIPTDYDSGELKSKSATIFPNCLTQRSFEDCAYLRMRWDKKKFPVQYRDSAVLVLGRFFSGKEIRSFVKRNRWVSFVLLDASEKSSDAVPVKLKSKLLSCTDFEWDTDAIRYLVARFLCFLVDLQKDREAFRKKLKEKLSDIEMCLFRYNLPSGVKRLSPTEMYFLRQQMLTLDLFLESCQKDKVFGGKEKKWIRATWFNLLLPGCCVVPPGPGDQEGQTKQPVIDPQEAAVQTFENILAKMLEGDNLNHFLYVPQGEFYDLENPDESGIRYWGYLRSYPLKKDQDRAFPALVFRTHDFETFSADFLEENDDPKFLIQALRKSGAAYCHSTDKMAFPEGLGDKKKKGALILKINEMNFLPGALKESLLSKIPSKDSQRKEP